MKQCIDYIDLFDEAISPVAYIILSCLPDYYDIYKGNDSIYLFYRDNLTIEKLADPNLEFLWNRKITSTSDSSYRNKQAMRKLKNNPPTFMQALTKFEEWLDKQDFTKKFAVKIWW